MFLSPVDTIFTPYYYSSYPSSPSSPGPSVLPQLLWFHASGSVYSGTVEASYEKQQRVVCGRGGEGPQEMTGSLTPILTLIYVLFYISLCKLKKKKKNHSCLCCSQNRSGYGKPTSRKKTTLLFSDLINKRP